ncbi:hypothetical protein BDC45DRAFT_570163 [Circinella umbellata]|nr:hypothetical protein BDC45DRAFT_570163 [Circinella umbellata]
MQSMPYYQQNYQPNGSYSNNGSPVPSSVLSNGGAPPMMTHANGMSPLPHQPLGDTTTTTTTATATQSQQPPKRKQVKNACTNCQKACKKCDDARPCPRCIKYGIAETCVNSVRKERKKGIKRGPYKRRQKDGSERTSSSSSRHKEDNSTTSSLLDSHQPPQPAQASHQSSPYMRPPSMAFGYPSNLNQYGQPTTYDPYSSYAAAYHKDQMMSQSYVVNPMYQSMGYPVLMPGATEGQQHQQQQQQQPQPQQQQQQPQHASYGSAQHSPVPQQHYLLHQQQSSRQFSDHMLHQQSQNTSSSAHMYYQQQTTQHQPHQPHQPAPPPQQPQQTQQHTPQQQRHLPDIKELQDGFMKPQPMTPVPSASTSSGTSTPPESTEDEDGSKYARLSQLCTAALHHNGTTTTTTNTTTNTSSEQQNSHASSPNPQQQS